MCWETTVIPPTWVGAPPVASQWPEVCSPPHLAPLTSCIASLPQACRGDLQLVLPGEQLGLACTCLPSSQDEGHFRSKQSPASLCCLPRLPHLLLCSDSPSGVLMLLTWLGNGRGGSVSDNSPFHESLILEPLGLGFHKFTLEVGNEPRVSRPVCGFTCGRFCVPNPTPLLRLVGP